METYGNTENCEIRSDDTLYNGMRTVILENRYLRISVIPEYGGKICEFLYKPKNYNFLWENVRIKDRKAHYGANYDNFQTGGIEDAFPTGLPSTYMGEELPFFGEVWAVPWNFSIIQAQQKVSIKLECFCSIYPVKIQKTITLEKDAYGIKVEYRIENLSRMELDYLFGVHPSISINRDFRINVPKGHYDINAIQPETWKDRSFKSQQDKRFEWPFLKDFDLSYVPDENENMYMNIYSRLFSEGRVNLFNEKEKIGFGISFDPKLFRFLSVWLIYGGWRGHYCIMVEPFTSWPLALDKAVDNGSALKLGPNQVIDTEVSYFISQYLGG